MGRFNSQQLAALLPHASASFMRLNAELFSPSTPPPATTSAPDDPKPAKPAKRARRGRQAYSQTQGAIAECPVRQAPMVTHEGEAFYTGRVSVRVTSYRRRLLDPDNLCAKWFLDACRYSRLIRDDRPEDITFSVSQEKVTRPEDERTEILIEPTP